MKILLDIFLIFAIFQVVRGQQTAQKFNISSRQSQPSQYNELIINTDRFVSTIEQKLNHLLKSELNVIRHDLQRLDHTHTIDKIIKSVETLKNSIDNIQDEWLQKQVFDISPSHESKTKIDNLQNSVLALRQSANRIEKELAIIKKSSRTMNTRHQFNHPVMYGGNNLYHDHESACISSDLHSESGIRKIKKDLFAYCEMTPDDGNWIVILNRFDGSMNFFRNWMEYKEGFGNIAGEHWMGLEKIHQMTSTRLHELMIVMEDFNGQKKSARYSAFGIASESLGYALNLLGSYSGNAGDCLSYHAGMKFSTYDADNDEWTDGACSKSHFGGWWYNKCDMTNLNGLYFSNGHIPDNSIDLHGMHWKYDKQTAAILKSVKMMIRPVE